MTSTQQSTERSDRFGLLVLVLVAILLISGVSDSATVRLIASVLNVVALLIGFGTPDLRHPGLAIVGLTLAGLIGGALVASNNVDGVGGALGATGQVILLIGLTLVLLGKLTRHQRVTTQTLLGGVAVYLVLGQAFAWSYLALPGYLDEAVIQPAREGEIPIYYSYVVLTTLGFGDVQPIGALAQRVSILEALVGQLYLAILISRLVSVWSRNEEGLWSQSR